MANIGTIFASLGLDRTDFNRERRLAEGDVRESTRRMKNSFADLRSSLVGLFAGLAIKETFQSLFEAGTDIRRLKLSFEEITGSVTAANAEMMFLRRTADDLGQNFYDLTDVYKSLLAASRETNLEGQATRDIFFAVTKASATLGLSVDSTRGALRAIEQMMSKGNVQAEELRGQLGERLPGAFNMAAKAMNVTTQELNDMLDRGEVLAEDLLPKLARVLSERYSGAVDESVRATNKWREAWTKLKTSMAQSGFLTSATEALQTLTTTISSPGVIEGFKTFAKVLGSVGQAFANIIQSLAGWEAVGAGNLGFFEFATMNAEELSKWLKENYSDVGRLGLEIKQLYAKIDEENNKLLYSPQANAARTERVRALYREIELLKERRRVLQETGTDPGVIDTWFDHVEDLGDVFDGALDKVEKGTKDLFDTTSSAINAALNSAMETAGNMYSAQVSIVEEAKNAGDTYKEVWDQIRSSEYQAWEQSYRNIAELEKNRNNLTKSEHQQMLDDMKEAFSGWASSFGSTLNDLLWNAETTFDDILKSFGKMITQMLIQSAVVEPLLGAFNRTFRPTNTGGTSTTTPTPNRATGGYVAPYSSVWVGERGRELLQMGSAAGYVHPERDKGAQQNATALVNINIDNRSPDVEISTERRKVDGLEEVDVIIDNIGGKKVNETGSSMDRSLKKKYNVRQTLIGR